MSARPSEAARSALTLVLAASGAAACAALNMPVAWLSGAMITTAALAMAGVPVAMTPLLRDFGLLVAGVSLGSTVTSDALQTIARYPYSLLGLILSVAATVAVSRRILERRYGWDRPTAFLAAVPGALSMVMALAAQSAGDVRRVAMVQAIRIFALVAIMPLLITATTPLAAGPSHAVITAGNMALLFLAGLALTRIMRWLRFANPLFLGGMIASTGLHISGLVPGELPPLLSTLAMVLIGIFAGLRFEGATPRHLLSALAPGLMSLSVATAISCVIAYVVHRATGLKLAEVLVAFAPGGLEAMVMMGASMGLDMLYISTHHVIRAVGLNIVTPFFAPLRAEDA